MAAAAADSGLQIAHDGRSVAISGSCRVELLGFCPCVGGPMFWDKTLQLCPSLATIGTDILGQAEDSNGQNRSSLGICGDLLGNKTAAMPASRPALERQDQAKWHCAGLTRSRRQDHYLTSRKWSERCFWPGHDEFSKRVGIAAGRWRDT